MQLTFLEGVAVDEAGNLYIADASISLIRKVDAATGVISTVAGGGSSLGDGGAATATQLTFPEGVAVDGSGNLYIADADSRIRKVDAATGVISTVAGDRTSGFSGDGGAATEAQLNSPSSVAVDGSGNLYIADRNNHRIRKVDAATGNITTVAGDGTEGYGGDGGAATEAQLNSPSSVAVDGSGNLYIADRNNHRIRKVDAATGNITTVAGDGTEGYGGDGGAATAAQLNDPEDIAVDGSGNLYIADLGNQRIRKVDAATGVISTVAGDRTSGFSGDGGAATAAQLSAPSSVAVDGSGNLYIADRNNQRIRKVDAATGVISSVAGGGTGGDGGAATAAQLVVPYRVAVDGSGNLYISDILSHRIRKVDAATGVISTVAGNGTFGYGGDGEAATAAQLRIPIGVAVDGSGNLYIADQGNRRIRKVDAATGVISTVAGDGTSGFGGDGGPAVAAQLGSPYGVAVDGSGNLYIAGGASRIRKVDAATGVITTVAGDGTQGFGGDGGAATAAQLSSPSDVAVDGSSNLYIADQGNRRIRKVDAATGVISTVAGGGSSLGDGGAATAAQLLMPRLTGVAVDGSGNLYIAGGASRIRKVDAATGVISTVAGGGSSLGDGGAATAAQLSSPIGVAVDGSGNLYIADQGNRRIRKVDFTTVPPITGPTVTLSAQPTSIVRGQSATLTWTSTNAVSAEIDQGIGDVAPAAGGSIQVRPTQTTTYTITVTAADSRTAAASATVAVSEPRTPVNTLGGTGDPGFGGDGGRAAEAQVDSPGGAARDAAGNLYVADTNNHRIRKIDAAGVITTVAGNGTPGFDGDDGPAKQAQLNFPAGVALDAAGNLYIADTNNHRVRKVDALGTVTTVAGNGIAGFDGDGGPADEAQLNSPRGVALDGSGNLYIADTNNHRVRAVDAATETIDTIAGDGTPGPLNFPYDVAVDAAGNLYIADTSNHRVLASNSPFFAAQRSAKGAPQGRAQSPLSDPILIAVAGSGTAGFDGDGGAAVNALLDSPSSVAVDAEGVLYIADTNNHRIRRVDAAGAIETVAGSGMAGYDGDGGEATATQLNAPQGIVVDETGALYIVDSGNHRIRRVAAPPLPPDPPVVRPPTPEPAVRARTFELLFALRQDAAPAAQQVTLYAENGDADFRAQPSQRWIAVAPSSGSLAEGEETMVEVTVDPAGLRVGLHEGRLYVRSGGRATARVRIELEVLPPEGPAVAERGVVNAAAMSALGEQGLFGARLRPLAPGSLVVVQGENFTGGGTVEAEGFPLPASLDGATVRFDDLEARLFSVGPQRIEAQLPSLLGMEESLEAGGTSLATVVVETAEGSSYPRRFFIAAHVPGIFTISGEGTGQAAALLAGAGVLAAPRGAVGESRPARAGDVLEIYATGLGPVQPPLADGENSCGPEGVCLADGSNVVLRRTLERPRVSVGGVEVAEDAVLFSGLAPALVGVNLVVVEVPAGIEPSAAAEVVVSIGGRASQSGVTIAVE